MIPYSGAAVIHDALVAVGIPIDGVSFDGGVSIISFKPEATTQQRTDGVAIAAAIDHSAPAQAIRDLAALKVAAKVQLDTATDAGARAAKAIVILTVDEINALRQWVMAFKAATAAATSLANLQTRVAALPNMPDRTLLQAKTAMNATIDAQT